MIFASGCDRGRSSVTLRLTFARQIESLESNRIFVLFTALTALGLALTYAEDSVRSLVVGALAFIAKGSGNELKASLYEQYSAGILSLRYLVIFLHRWLSTDSSM